MATGKIVFKNGIQTTIATEHDSLKTYLEGILGFQLFPKDDHYEATVAFTLTLSNGEKFNIPKDKFFYYTDEGSGAISLSTTDDWHLKAWNDGYGSDFKADKIYFAKKDFFNVNDAEVVSVIKVVPLELDKPFEIRRFFHNNRQLDYSMMSTLLKDYDNAYGAKRAPAPDVDWRDLSEINGDLKFEVLECEDASFVGEYKIDKTGGNGHLSYWFAGGEPNVATKHALFKLKKKQQDGTYASTDYEVGCTASDGAGEGWWQEAITPATRKDHWVIRINGGASGVVSSCKFTRVVNPTNQVKFTKDNYKVILQRLTATANYGNMFKSSVLNLKDLIANSTVNGANVSIRRIILNLVRQNLNGTTGSGTINSEGVDYNYWSDKVQPDGTLYNPEPSWTLEGLSQINWDVVSEIKFRIRGGQYALDLSTTNPQDPATAYVSFKKENNKYLFKLNEISGTGAASSIGADWTEFTEGNMKEIATMISGRNVKLYAKIINNRIYFALSGNSSAVNIRLIVDNFVITYYND